MNYYERALELKDETIANRRHIHKMLKLVWIFQRPKLMLWKS